MTATMPIRPHYLNAQTSGRPVGVDREAKVIRGYVVAQGGPFREPMPRGEFDELSLTRLVQLERSNPNGVKSRFTHPTMSDDGLGKFLGRSREWHLSTATVIRDGRTVEVPAVRGNLHIADSSFDAPSGNLGGYVLDLAEKDSDALSSSVVIQVEEEYRIEKDGTPKLDAKGEPLPPLWRPTHLHASDIVDEGAAVDGLLSIGAGITHEMLRQGCTLLDQQFAGQPRDVVEARVLEWLGRYLDLRFGADDVQERRDELRRKILEARKVG